jgi:hypothetical protein
MSSILIVLLSGSTPVFTLPKLSAPQKEALLAFKASGCQIVPTQPNCAANAAVLASWTAGTDPCGANWAGVTCSGGAVVAVKKLVIFFDNKLPIGPGNDGKSCNVAGDITALAPLTQLTHLDLTCTNVVGDIKSLAPLVQLTDLRLLETKVTGDVQGMAPLTRLTYLQLSETKVTGEAAALDPLTRLTYLGLFETAVEGCDAFCAVGGPFHAHCDPVHGVDGCNNGGNQDNHGCTCP